MRTEEKTAVKNSIGRMAFVLLSLLGQIGWLIFQVVKLNQYSTGISLFTSFLALLVVIRIYGMHSNAAMKMPWIILILAFPVLGLCLYLLLGRPGLTRNMQKRFERVDSELLPRLQKNPAVMQALEEKDMGKTIFLSSHMFDEVEKTCDRIAIIKNGHLAAIENTADVRRQRKKTYMVTFETRAMADAFSEEAFEIKEITGTTATVRVTGELQEFLRALEKYKVTNLDVRTESLEEIFMHYYGGDTN